MAKDNQNAHPKNNFTEFSNVIKTYDEVLAHYDFVISDLSSEIYNPILRAGQQQAVTYLTAMRAEWQKCRDDALKQLNERRNKPQL